MAEYLHPVINVKKMHDLIRYKNWRHPYATIARKTGFSLSYVRRVLLGHEQLTSRFMGALLAISGLNPQDPEEWSGLFSWTDKKLPPPAHRSWNYDKFNGRRPYQPYSVEYHFRLRDNPDLEQLKDEEDDDDEDKTTCSA